MLQDPVARRGFDEGWLSATHPQTFSYVKRFEGALRGRSGYRRYFKPSDAFYSVLNVGQYTFAPYKVVWPNIASAITAAVVGTIGDKPMVPQHIVTLIATEDQNEAHYVCAMVNSSPFNFAVQSYSQRGGKSFGTPSILDRVRVPRFDSRDASHRQLAHLSQSAHLATAAGNSVEVGAIEAEIDKRASDVWNLEPDELRSIQESLAELQSRPYASVEDSPPTDDE